jgi:hypothetical protein
MLDLADLKTNLKAAFDATQVASDSAADAEQAFVNAMATAIDTYVKTASIIYSAGLAAPGGPVTGDFVGGLE